MTRPWRTTLTLTLTLTLTPTLTPTLTLTRPVADDRVLDLSFCAELGAADFHAVAQHGQSAVWAVSQLGSCASSGRA